MECKEENARNFAIAMISKLWQYISWKDQ